MGELHRGVFVARDADEGVHPGRDVVAAIEVCAARDHAPDRRVRVERPLAYPGHREILAGEPELRRRLHAQEAVVRPAGTAHGTGSAEDPDRAPLHEPDAAGMEQTAEPAQTEVEDRGSLLEELSLLRKEEREPGQVDLLVVGLHLGEIRIGREVQREIRGGAVAHIEARLATVVAGHVERVRRLVELRLTLPPAQHVRRHVGRRPAMDSLE